MIRDHYDLVIVGGGQVGMALALALRDSGLSVLLLEARDFPAQSDDLRPLALSHGSRLILQRLGVWDALPSVTPITTIHVSNRGSFGRTVMTAAELRVPALGYVVNHHDVFRAMHAMLGKEDMTFLTGVKVTKTGREGEFGQVTCQHGGAEKQITAKLVVIADGGKLAGQVEGISAHVHDYGQHAVVANLRTGLPQSGTAYERFTAEGPIALLPVGEYFSMVWTVAPAAAETIIRLDEAAFLTRLHAHFGDRLGRFAAAGPRSAFPLSLKYVRPVTAYSTVLIGNAAQTLHPVAGQGFNLGLRDAWELSCEILVAPSETGKPAMLERYRDRRRLDSNGGRVFTDTLVRLFSNENSLLQGALGLGLNALGCLPPARRFVARRMMFGARG